MRGEVGYDKLVGEASLVALEVLPIFGYCAGRWTAPVSVNTSRLCPVMGDFEGRVGKLGIAARKTAWVTTAHDAILFKTGFARSN